MQRGPCDGGGMQGDRQGTELEAPMLNNNNILHASSLKHPGKHSQHGEVYADLLHHCLPWWSPGGCKEAWGLPLFKDARLKWCDL